MWQTKGGFGSQLVLGSEEVKKEEGSEEADGRVPLSLHLSVTLPFNKENKYKSHY